MLRGRDGVAGRRVDDGDAGAGRRVEIDVVDADARPADDLQPRSRRDRLRVDLDLAADDERVIVGQRGEKLLAGESRPVVDIVLGAEKIDALSGEGFCDEDPHAGTVAAVGAPIPAAPSDSTAAA